MLAELHIRNFAIIDDLRLTFGPGLNILTGETGAGKSIIIDAVGLLLGDRAAAEWVRAGSEMASIEAIFLLPAEETRGGALRVGPGEGAGADGAEPDVGEPDVGEPDAGESDAGESDAGESDAGESDAGEPGAVGIPSPRALRTTLAREGLDDPDNPESVTLAREVRRNGRNICRINGRAVSLQLLAEITQALVDIHGQGEHLSLLQPRTHVGLLDRYAGLLPRRAEVAAHVGELRRVRRELQRLRHDARTVAQRIDLLSFQVEEIDAARLRPGEEAELEGERRRLANAESLLKLAQASAALLVGGDNGAGGIRMGEGDSESPAALDLVGEAVGRLEKLARIDPDLQPRAEEAQALLEQLNDLARVLEDYADGLEFNPARLQEVEERLELVAVLKRKYGDTLDQVLAYGRRAAHELERLSHWEAHSAELEAREETLLHVVGEQGAALGELRRRAGERLARAVEQELADLKMARARFGISVRQVEQSDGARLPDGRRVRFDATGVDEVEFLISANPGEPLKPMARVASGGETARLMLALKGTLAHADATPTLIFDEIDQGIGGRVGAVVGHKLWLLTGRAAHGGGTGEHTNPGDDSAVEHQVLCITHLPQLATWGDAHYTVNKRVGIVDGVERTRTEVRCLEGEERIAELTQMLGAPGDAGRRSVEEMLGEVAGVKQAAARP